MKKGYIALCTVTGLLQLASINKAICQAPSLPVRQALSQSLVTNRSFGITGQLDTMVRSQDLPQEYSFELSAKIASVIGRGLDFEARNNGMSGFRITLDTNSLKWTAPLASPVDLSHAATGSDQRIRVAVKGDSAYIYQNGYFVLARPLTAIKPIQNGLEIDEAVNSVGSNLTESWAGSPGNNSGRPTDYGWAQTGSTNANMFNVANGTSDVRYMDITPTSSNAHTLNGSPWTGRVLYIRWDGGNVQNTVYSYAVTLEANTSYEFSLLHGYISNAPGSKTITAGIGKTVAATDRLVSKTFYPVGTRELTREGFTFRTQEAGVYYLTFTGDWALFSIAELSLKKFAVSPRVILGKNYTAGSADILVSNLSYDAGAYAPVAPETSGRATVTLTGKSISLPMSVNTDFIVPGKTDVHLTGEPTVLVNSSIALNSEDAWLFFDNIKPSVVLSDWLDKITVKGASAKNNAAVRLAVYGHGTVLIPTGNQTSQAALEVYSQPNLSGNNRTFPIETIHKQLGEFDNNVRSFRLKRGYMATLANSPDGTGYSRVFVANDSDIVVNNMPTGLDKTISFIRVVKWNWPTKKGKAGSGSPVEMTNSTWFYDWNVASNTTTNAEYAIIRQTRYWPGWADLANKTNVSHVLGFNEPDRPDQADMTVDEAVAQWPEIMKTGLRVGSPAPANPPGWLNDFMSKCDSMNYRVDYVAIHCYWGGLSPQQWYNQLKAIYDKFKRPIWITEWNNGANWTTESWPSEQSAQFQKQLSDLKGILTVLDTSSFIERYAIYDWVEDKRALILGDTLTPAGHYYANNRSKMAYNPSMEYNHTWKLAVPIITRNTGSDVYRVTLGWNDVNGELGAKYVLERKIDGRDADFSLLEEYSGYNAGAAMSRIDSVYRRATYRLKVVGIDGSVAYSAEYVVIGDQPPFAPTSLTGDVVSATRIRLNWQAGVNARSYNLKRSLNPSGPFTTISANTTALTYLDQGLEGGTTYYYVVSSVNIDGESVNSAVLAMTTLTLTLPGIVSNPRVGSGDRQSALTWDLTNDVDYYILRSDAGAGSFDTIARNVDAIRYEDLSRENERTYYYKIIAHNEKGFGPETAVLSATPVLGQHLYVSFDETASIVAQDFWGGYHADFKSSASRAAGYRSNALKLNGSSNAYAALRPGAVSKLTNFTISIWVNLETVSDWMRILDFGKGTNNYMYLSPQVSSPSQGVSVLRYTIKNGGPEQNLAYNFTWPLNSWVHIVVTQSESLAKMYINGTQVASTTGITIRPADLGITTQNYIGKSEFSADPMLRGMVDELKIFNNVLSDENIRNLYNGTPLPVKILSFEGKGTQDGNLLNWTTAQEFNSDYFEVERSASVPGNFASIARLKSTGGNYPTSYKYLDALATASLNYYRLKQVDQDGKVQFSQVVAISSHATGEVTVTPNPVKNIMRINLPNEAPVRLNVTLFTSSGQQVYDRQETSVSGYIKMDISRLAAGHYRLLLSGAGYNKVVTIIKE